MKKNIVRDLMFCRSTTIGLDDINDKSDSKKISAVSLMTLIVLSMIAAIIAGISFAAGILIKLYSAHPYLFCAIVAGLAGSAVAILLHMGLTRISRKEIKLPKHLTCGDK